MSHTGLCSANHTDAHHLQFLDDCMAAMSPAHEPPLVSGFAILRARLQLSMSALSFPKDALYETNGLSIRGHPPNPQSCRLESPSPFKVHGVSQYLAAAWDLQKWHKDSLCRHSNEVASLDRFVKLKKTSHWQWQQASVSRELL